MIILKDSAPWHHTAIAIAEIMREEDLSPATLAATLGVNPAFIRSLLAGAKGLPPRHAVTIARTGMVGVDFLKRAHVADIAAQWERSVAFCQKT